MIWILIIAVVLVLSGFLLSDAFIEIPAYHFGVVKRFGGRTGRIMEEGLRLKLPFIDFAELESLELVGIDVPADFTTKDKLKLTCKGSLQYRADPEICNERGCVFVEMSESIIKSGISDTIKAKLGALGGVKEGSDFIESRHAIADMINCFFRLERPPHRDHDPAHCSVCNDSGVAPLPPGNKINAEVLLDYYRTHWVVVREALERAKETLSRSRSEVERRYGIDIEHYALSSIDFSEETTKAFEKQKQADARAGAFDRKIEMAKKVLSLGASAQVALNAADISLDPSVEKKVVSIEGDAGVLGGLVAGIMKGEKK